MAEWSGEEVELIVADYFEMLSLELLGASPNSGNNGAPSLIGLVQTRFNNSRGRPTVLLTVGVRLRPRK